MRLQGKTAIITGGGTGIGLACSRLFCREGAQAAIFGRRADRLESAAKEIGPGILPIVGDVTKNEDLDRLVRETLNAFGKIDIVVHNSGVFPGAPLHEITDEDWDATMDVNMRSIFQLTKRVLPHMIERKSGNFIHISSILGLVAVPGVAAYNTSKGALLQFNRSIAMEYGPMGIRSNAVCPGLVETEMTADLMNDKELMAEWSKDYPIGRFGVPEDIANACLYFASDESSFVTGTALPVDGGFTAH
ncbi:MAG: SDR family oxidoreductase [Nitrospinae bacterium]|nr:SDR family oxidoreductase [Nitrospinota bacterium]